MSELLQCQDCSFVGPEDEFTGLSEDDVSQIMESDGENIGSPDDYSDLVGCTACPECRSQNYTYLWD